MGMMLTLVYLPFVRTNDFLPGYRPTIKINTIRLLFVRRARIQPHTIRYYTRCYFYVRSKADMSQLNLPHGNDN